MFQPSQHSMPVQTSLADNPASHSAAAFLNGEPLLKQADDIALLVEGIAQHGYAVCQQFLPAAEIEAMAARARQLFTNGEMRRAGIGKLAIQHEIRGDYLHWLQPDAAEECERVYQQRMETLRSALNRELYLGLFELQSHFALYPAGASYGKHLDRLQANALNANSPKVITAARPQRQISSILYMNPGWHSEEGGQLRLYLGDGGSQPYLDIEPAAGTLVLFLSATFFHEVLAASRERLSIAGWFSCRGEAVL